MKIHDLKTNADFWERVSQGFKTGEIRIDDNRNFQVDDYLYLSNSNCRQVDVEVGCVVQITDIVTHEDFPNGLKPGYSMLSIRLLKKREHMQVIELLMLQRRKEEGSDVNSN